MELEEIVEWVDKNTWGSDVEGGDRCSYEDFELRRLTEAALRCVPDGGLMVEIGVYAGRSLAALLMVARVRNARVWACDPFTWNGHLSEPRLKELLKLFTDVDLTFLRGTSSELRQQMPKEPIHLLHIDGDHKDVATDCKLWLPSLESGKEVVFHDVVNDIRSSIYMLYLAVQDYTETWETISWAQDTEGHQMIRRKP